eukprot:TRINITY_DN1349_c0_g1_i3.p1 TRINITY_DN1349_c0_g1~~TRINITY_DN1349_c0_g1_i3.p1  ORF type:complete len:358 (+),score=35.36 TRINITY_DN1349_c0_g1_i3:36-1109(+)
MSGGASTADVVWEKKTAKKSNAVFNLVNSIIGGGLLALPFAFSSVGIGLGTIMLMASALLVIYSAKLLIFCSSSPIDGGTNYKELAANTIGPTVGPIIIEISIILFLAGALIGYIIILGDFLPSLLDLVWKNNEVKKEYIQIIVAAVFLFPLTSLRRITTLSYLSLVAIVCIFFMAIGVVVRGSQFLHEYGVQKDRLKVFSFGGGIFTSFPIISFAFTFHPGLFPIRNEMIDSSAKSISICVWIAVAICAFVYQSVAVFGYLRWYDDVSENIIVNYVEDSLFYAVKAGYSVIIILSYPLLGYIASCYYYNSCDHCSKHWRRLWAMGCNCRAVHNIYISSLLLHSAIYIPRELHRRDC